MRTTKPSVLLKTVFTAQCVACLVGVQADDAAWVSAPYNADSSHLSHNVIEYRDLSREVLRRFTWGYQHSHDGGGGNGYYFSQRLGRRGNVVTVQNYGWEHWMRSDMNASIRYNRTPNYFSSVRSLRGHASGNAMLAVDYRNPKKNWIVEIVVDFWWDELDSEGSRVGTGWHSTSPSKADQSGRVTVSSPFQTEMKGAESWIIELDTQVASL